MPVRPVLVCAFLLLGFSVASAQPTPQQKKAARAHFNQGKAYYEAGLWDQAASEYEKAYALVPLPELLFNIGQAYRMKGDKPKAIEAYQKYLEKAPEGPLAEEARTHVAALRLKIQVEEAEAAKRRAEEEAAAAKRRAEEEAAARRRAEEEAAARRRALVADEERLKRLAAEEAERQRLRREAEEAERAKRVEAARKEGGRRLRLIGNLTIGAGSLLVVSTLIPIARGSKAGDDLKQFDNDWRNNWTWTPELDDAVAQRDASQRAAAALAVTGVIVITAGIVIYAVGASKRKKAVEAARNARISFVPAARFGAGALTLGGGF